MTTRVPFAPRLTRGLAFGALLLLGALLAAGRTDRPALIAWAVVLGLGAVVAVLTIDPELARERLRAGQTGADPRRLAAIRLLFLAHFVVGLLDVRFASFARVPAIIQGLGLIAFAGGIAGTLWSVATNRFFVPVIRVQSERGHHVVRTGPYARVRHPGYAGMAVAAPASALAMGSWWALLPALGVSFLFIARAAHEDRFLLERLDGYPAYARDVRWRLVPGLW